MTDAEGEARPAADWVGPSGRARNLRGADVTAERYQVRTVVYVKTTDMQEP